MKFWQWNTLFYGSLIIACKFMLYRCWAKDSKEALQEGFEQFQKRLRLGQQWKKERKLEKIEEVLAGYSTLTWDSPAEIWEKKIEELQQALREELPLEEFNLEGEQIFVLKRYIQATHLLWDCLQNASCPNQEEVVNQLFRVPSMMN